MDKSKHFLVKISLENNFPVNSFNPIALILINKIKLDIPQRRFIGLGLKDIQSNVFVIKDDNLIKF